MIFTNLEFLLLMLLCLPACLLLRRQTNTVLLITSYVFYGWWDWRFVSLLLLSSMIDFVCGLLADKDNIAPGRDVVRRWAVTISVLSNLSILGVFKYLGFFSDSFVKLAGLIGWELTPLVSHFILPAGISFYTFQSMSYSIDVYRGELKSTTNVRDFLLYVSFFPQLVAGPIERGAKLLPQIVQGAQLTRRGVQSGGALILVGFFKKLVIADNVADTVDVVFGSSQATGLDYLIGGYAFALQIYCDFSGYTDIARGLARFFGIELMENFRAPFLAANPREFWRNWHISLSTWFRDYLYIPLGGNRSGFRRTSINLALTMLLCGLWHGASYNFIVWGVFHGLLLAAYRSLGLIRGDDDSGNRFRHVVAILIFFHLNLLGWIIFRCSETPWQLANVWSNVLGNHGEGLLDIALAGPIAVYYALILTLQFFIRKHGRSDFLLNLSAVSKVLIYSLLTLGILHFAAEDSRAFVYFQF